MELTTIMVIVKIVIALVKLVKMEIHVLPVQAKNIESLTINNVYVKIDTKK